MSRQLQPQRDLGLAHLNKIITNGQMHAQLRTLKSDRHRWESLPTPLVYTSPRKNALGEIGKNLCMFHGMQIKHNGSCSGNASKGCHILGNKCSVDCISRTWLQNYIAVSDVTSTDVILYMHMFGKG